MFFKWRGIHTLTAASETHAIGGQVEEPQLQGQPLAVLLLMTMLSGHSEEEGAGGLGPGPLPKELFVQA